MQRHSKALCVFTSAIALTIGCAAQAQTAQAPADNGEIIVTAQKREQNLQDVPVSVSVLSSAALINNRVAGIDQLAQIAPSVNFTNSANTRGQGVSVRGIGTLNFSDGVEPSVSTVIDGVVIGRSAASFFDFSDINRVEVLRGPQGTLFGKNASAGAINLVTEKPNLTKNTLDAAVSYGSYNDLRIKGSASVVLDQGRLAMRVSGFRSTADGVITNLYNGQNLNNTNGWGLRGKLLWEPDSDTSLYIIGDYSKNDRRCCVSTIRSILPTTTYYTGQTRTQLTAGQQLGPINRTVNINGDTFGNQSANGVSAEFNTKVLGQTLTAISAYRTFKSFDNNDLDGTQINIYDLNNALQNQKQFTQELRLTSPAHQRLEYVLGLYYFWQDLKTTTQVAGNGPTALPPGQFLGAQVDRGIKSNNGAAFGQLTFHATDALSLIGGFRYTAEDATANFNRYNMPGAAGPGQSGAAYLSPPLHFANRDFSYKLGADYKISRDLMAYVTYTRGYKGPAINMLNNLNAAVVNSGQAILKPEIARNLEVGLRTQMFDRKLTFNVTGFHETFENFQAQTFNALLSTFTLSNAGKLTSNGVELEASVRAAPGLNLSSNVAYTETKVDGFIISCYPGQTAALGCTGGQQNVSGQSLANAPKWAFTLGADYTRDIGDNLRAKANLGYTYRSSVFFAYSDPNTVQGGYGLLNGSLSLETQDRRYRLTVWGKNLGNQHFVTSMGTGYLDTSSTGAGYTQLLTTDAFRTVGVEAAVRF
ncbi:TonB-dependent receptor [Novosphingobium sp. SG707]|uniref:TonB-dependent receptor n=1 Tax=Novosphingobium sp. SG707 TaxID=2586996 RepID=UPI001447BE4A|nr:TonB-dependent receptor [Novosphingobium sp. SG707]NKI98799.1 iron complex outermembrane receptor protein [Novosphingobium sp. SG707]